MRQIITTLCILFLFSCDKAALSDTSATAAYGPAGQGGSMARFTIAGNYLYAVDKQNLHVFDVSDPATPVLRRTVPVGFEIETIFPFKDRLFIGSTSVVHIFSIEDPSFPKKLSEAISPDVLRRCDPVVARDTVAYATLRSNGPCGGTMSILAVYDIKNVSKPVQRTSIPVSEPYGLGYSNNTLYVCDRERGLLIFDITQTYNPVFVKAVKHGSYIDVIPYQDVLVCWTTKGMLLYDISENNSPELLTEIN